MSKGRIQDAGATENLEREQAGKGVGSQGNRSQGKRSQGCFQVWRDVSEVMSQESRSSAATGWPSPHLGGGPPGRRCKDPEVEVWSRAWGEVRGWLWPDQGSFRKSLAGNGTPLQYSCLENPMDGGPWWAAVHWVAESDTTEPLHFHFHFTNY